jgi:hypothetical protein
LNGAVSTVPSRAGLCSADSAASVTVGRAAGASSGVEGERMRLSTCRSAGPMELTNATTPAACQGRWAKSVRGEMRARQGECSRTRLSGKRSRGQAGRRQVGQAGVSCKWLSMHTLRSRRPVSPKPKQTDSSLSHPHPGFAPAEDVAATDEVAGLGQLPIAAGQFPPTESGG